LQKKNFIVFSESFTQFLPITLGFPKKPKPVGKKTYQKPGALSFFRFLRGKWEKKKKILPIGGENFFFFLPWGGLPNFVVSFFQNIFCTWLEGSAVLVCYCT